MGSKGAAMPRLNFLLTLAWDGTDFEGWQRQPGRVRSVQLCIEAALSKVLAEPVEVTGASRTDKGVHAEGQALSFHSRSPMPPASILAALDRELPPDLAALTLRTVDPRFHARYRAKSKLYRYRLYLADRPNPLLRRYSHHVIGILDLVAMREAAALLAGERDFRKLSNEKEKSDTVRRLLAARVEARRCEGGLAGAAIEEATTRGPAIVDLLFEGDGFLHNQVRIMSALVLEAGLGKRSLESVGQLLAAGGRQDAPGALGAWGLTLLSVSY